MTILEHSAIRRILLAVIFALCLCPLFFSCISEKKRAEICRTCQRNDSVRVVKKDSISYRDSILFFTIEGPERWIPSPCDRFCDSLGRLKPIHIKVKKNGIVAELKSKGDSLLLSARADSLEAEIKKMRVDHFNEIEFYKNSVIQLPCENERTSIDGFFKWSALIFYACVIIVILGLVIRHYRDRAKLLEKK